jgi:hypothetical protein
MKHEELKPACEVISLDAHVPVFYR